MILSEILLLAFCCFVCVHMTVDLIKWKYMAVEDKSIEQAFAYAYIIIIVAWTAANHLIKFC